MRSLHEGRRRPKGLIACHLESCDSLTSSENDCANDLDSLIHSDSLNKAKKRKEEQPPKKRQNRVLIRHQDFISGESAQGAQEVLIDQIQPRVDEATKRSMGQVQTAGQIVNLASPHHLMHPMNGFRSSDSLEPNKTKDQAANDSLVREPDEREEQKTPQVKKASIERYHMQVPNEASRSDEDWSVAPPQAQSPAPR